MLQTRGQVAVVAGFRLQLEKHRKRPRVLSLSFEGGGKIVQKRMMCSRIRRRSFGRPLVPLDGVGVLALVQIQFGQH